MEPSNQSDEANLNDNCFFDALDDFHTDDCAITDQSDQSTLDSAVIEASSEVSDRATNLRRRSISGRGNSCAGLKDSNSESSGITSGLAQNNDTKRRYKEKRYKTYRDLRENEKNLDVTESTRWERDPVESVGIANKVGEDDNKRESRADVDPVGDSIGSSGVSSSANLLVFVAGLVIKVIGFQVNLIVNFITHPIWVLYSFYTLVIDPFGTVRRGRGFLIQKLVGSWNLVSGFFSLLIMDRLKEHKSIWKLFLRCGWGMFWSLYVGIILCGLLVFSIMVSGFLLRFLVENPIEIKDELHFDYTQNSPVAFVPIMLCSGVGCGLYCEERSLRPRVIPPNHKLQVNILLTLPESGYNRNLGIFQVRVDFLSADGKIITSKRQPCMLKFKSEPVRALLTFFKIAPLITGYTSESQTLKVKIRGFMEGDVPTSCLKVIIEQRAEFQPGAGVPEIYDAFLVLESELPVFKRIIWCWKKTLFVWISIMLFVIELLFTLICCSPVIIPRARTGDVRVVNNSTPHYVTDPS